MDISFSKPIAVIADVHGNSDALSAVLTDIKEQSVEVILNLGDHFSGPLTANETAKMIVDIDMICIRGNHDRALIENSPSSMGASDRVAYDQLDEIHLSWIKKLPATQTISDDIFMCHGTPWSDRTYWLESVSSDGDVTLRNYSEIEEAAKGISCSLLLCGHTHIPRAIRLIDGRLIVNPGSVGAPGYDDETPAHHIMQTGTPDACYAIVRKTNDHWQVNFRYVPYNSERMVELAKNAKRFEWARALATGWVNSENQ